MTARTIASGVIAALVAVGLAACSGDSGLTGAQKQDISSFKANGNAICSTANAQKHAALDQAKSSSATSAPESAKTFLVDSFIPIVEQELGDLHNLGEPTLDRASWDEIRGKLDSELADLKASIDRDPVSALQQLLAVPRGAGTSAVDKSLSDFGLPECAKV